MWFYKRAQGRDSGLGHHLQRGRLSVRVVLFFIVPAGA